MTETEKRRLLRNSQTFERSAVSGALGWKATHLRPLRVWEPVPELGSQTPPPPRSGSQGPRGRAPWPGRGRWGAAPPSGEQRGQSAPRRGSQWSHSPLPAVCPGPRRRPLRTEGGHTVRAQRRRWGAGAPCICKTATLESPSKPLDPSLQERSPWIFTFGNYFHCQGYDNRFVQVQMAGSLQVPELHRKAVTWHTFKKSSAI